MNHHRKYDSIVPWLYANHKEHFLSDEFRKTIPRATICGWRKGYDNYYGSEYRKHSDQAFDLYFMLQENRRLKILMTGLCKVWLSFSASALPVLRTDNNTASTILEQTQKLVSILPRRTALRLMGFNGQTFQYQIKKLLACTGSPIGVCIKQNPRQLCHQEIVAIRELFANKKYVCWPMVSLYYQGLREGTLRIGLSTFYKYARLLNLSRKFIKPKQRWVGIQTSAPNQFLHVDTTYYHHLDSGRKAAIAFASDNFSRFITGYTVALKNSALNIYQVLQQTIETIHQYHPDYQCLTKLVADGGSENHAVTITELLAGCKKPPIQKIIAKKDIEFSNSPIEAINKICKRYLRHFKPQTIEQLKAVIALVVHEYNTLRPHGALKGLTPLEAYQEKQPLSFTQAVADAQQARLMINKSRSCEVIC